MTGQRDWLAEAREDVMLSRLLASSVPGAGFASGMLRPIAPADEWLREQLSSGIPQSLRFQPRLTPEQKKLRSHLVKRGYQLGVSKQELALLFGVSRDVLEKHILYPGGIYPRDQRAMRRRAVWLANLCPVCKGYNYRRRSTLDRRFTCSPECQRRWEGGYRAKVDPVRREKMHRYAYRRLVRYPGEGTEDAVRFAAERLLELDTAAPARLRERARKILAGEVRGGRKSQWPEARRAHSARRHEAAKAARRGEAETVVHP